MVIGDQIQIRSIGQGMILCDYPDIKIMNVSPALFKKLPLTAGDSNNSIRIRITHEIPACIMGSGLGSNNTYIGDYDIQLNDKYAVSKYELDSLRFGDIVAITDADNTFGRIWRKNAISVGVVVHGGCLQAGHGPGVATLFTSSNGKIETVKDCDANIGKYLNLGRFRKKK